MRYLLVNEKMGIFLGVFGSVAIFSNVDKDGANVAYSFPTITEAKEFVKEIFNGDIENFKYLPINHNKEYVPLHTILNSGYIGYAGNMLLNTPMINKTIH